MCGYRSVADVRFTAIAIFPSPSTNNTKRAGDWCGIKGEATTSNDLLIELSAKSCEAQDQAGSFFAADCPYHTAIGLEGRAALSMSTVIQRGLPEEKNNACKFSCQSGTVCTCIQVVKKTNLTRQYIEHHALSLLCKAEKQDMKRQTKEPC